MSARLSFLALAFLSGVVRVVQTQEPPSAEQRAFIQADSEVFVAIARPHYEPGVDSVLYGGDSLEIDPRPWGEPKAFRDVAGGGTGLASKDLFFMPDSATWQRLTDVRKKILATIHRREGRGFSHPKCGGTLDVQPPPSGSDSTTNRSDARAGCPKAAGYYINVGIPVRGLPESFRKEGRPGRKPLDITGDVWTVVVNNHYVGPSGQNWFQHGVVLRRDPTTRQLRVAATVLLAWAE